LSTNKLPIVIRPATEADRMYIISAWVRTFTDSVVAKHLLNDHILGYYKGLLDESRPLASVYYYLQTELVKRLLGKYTTLVAVFEEDPELIWGFINGDPTTCVVNYVCVKQAYKRSGVATALCNALGCTKDRAVIFTHLTERVSGFIPKTWCYVPGRFCIHGMG
jgi:ribosomal protein S18 acetylase RimI-like enzyme